MRTEVRISFDGSDFPGGPQAILDSARCGQGVTVIQDVPVLHRIDVEVTLDATDERLRTLLELLAQHGMSWLDLRRDHHSDEELARAALIVPWPENEHTVFGGPRVGTRYDMEGACPVCGSGARQTSAMFIEEEAVAKIEGLRATSTYYSDILVDERIAEELENIGAAGLSFRSVYALLGNGRQVKLRWRQLCAAHTLPPMSPRTTGIGKEDFCKSCGRSGFSTKMDDPPRPMYRATDLRGSQDVNTTWEWFGPWKFDGNVSNALFSYPWFLVTPKVWRVFRDAGVTSFHWFPIRVEDGAG
jgi:hypothetical protein